MHDGQGTGARQTMKQFKQYCPIASLVSEVENGASIANTSPDYFELNK